MQGRFLVIASLAMAAQGAWGQTSLTAGDVAVIAFNSNPDDFAWVTLVDLAPGTAISFTDHSWEDGKFRNTEGTASWTFASAVSAGTVFTAASASANSMALATAGDQLFAYQGSASASPTLLAGLNFGNSGWISAGAASASLSYQPMTLTSGTSALQLVAPSQSAYYTGRTRGTLAELRAELFDPAHWASSGAGAQSAANWAGSFTVTAVPEAGRLTMLLVGLGLLGMRAHRQRC